MKRSLIKKTFETCKKEKRAALITYTVAGDYNKKVSLEILKNISKYADLLELGLPHNTPIADGSEIQNSTFRALKNNTSIKDVFMIINNYKKTVNPKPIIIMTYFNPIMQYGETKFVKGCKKNKVDGIICVDLPWPENKKFSKLCKKNNIEFIQLISPTTTHDRLFKIKKDSHNMCYYISSLSTTGGKLKKNPKKIFEKYQKIKKIYKNKNLVIGFGITDKTIGNFRKTDGVVCGSLICKTITESIKKRKNTVKSVSNLVKKLRMKIN